MMAAIDAAIDGSPNAALIEAGLSYWELREHFGWADRTIHRRLSRWGLRIVRARKSAD